MRPIKFRAWGVDTEVMHTWNFLQEIDKWWKHEALTLMHFTGLRDSNGQEIYEGDIVTLKNNDDYKDDKHMQGTGVVGWYQDELRFGWVDMHDSLYYKMMTWGGTKSVEVIGNIYQHPSLCKITNTENN